MWALTPDNGHLVQAQGELEFQGPVRRLPVGAEEPADALEALHHGVHVDVQHVLRPGLAHARGEVDPQRAQQLAAALRCSARWRGPVGARDTGRGAIALPRPGVLGE